MTGICRFACRLAAQLRQARVILIRDEILTKVGGHVLGNFLTSVSAGIRTRAWTPALGARYPVLPPEVIFLRLDFT
jgi:hypothetical protein